MEKAISAPLRPNLGEDYLRERDNLLLKDYANTCVVACLRYVRALRGDPLAVCTALPA